MAGQLPDETVEEIRKSNDIVDIVGDYVQLKRQGRNFFGLCPFHGEKTPSFSVTPDKQIFHCFGCGKGGNAITFIMEIEGFSFVQAIKYLAGKSGYHLSDSFLAEGNQSKPSKESQDVLQAFEWLTKLYHHLLRHSKDGKEGYHYLKERGFSDETIDTFQLGFSPKSKTFIMQFLEKKGFHPQSMVKAGVLTTTSDNEVVDRFQGRIIYPIKNHLGKPIAYGGRTISDQSPKYLNSPETELFQKGRLLYNFDLARSHIRKEGKVVLFEGYMDVISAYQAGIKNSVATLGTSITETQAKLLRRYVESVVICYDSDQAGILASYKAAKLLRKTGCNVSVAKMEDGMDPDDYIKKYGPEKFTKDVIAVSDTYMAFIMRYLKKDYNLNLEGDRIQYVENVLDEIALLDRPVEREHFLKELANEFELSVQTLSQEIRSRRAMTGLSQDKAARISHTNKKGLFQNNKLLPAYQNAERQLIAYMLRDPTIAEKVQENLGGSFNIEDHKIIVTYLYAFYEEGYPADVSSFVERLPDASIRSLVVQLAMLPTDEEVSEREIFDYIRIILREKNDKPTITSLMKEQRMAEKQKEPVKAAEIAMKILEIRKQLNDSNH
ncbi:DNA primase [Aquibacillus sp. 3ASR75-11]|uniref:DNA primase n=1 Tax=Terrihalobacillus insolitus TaxID=2950438 RepID=A0A9X4ANW7_9BACI|nr:DNA primase [Terrihalobacillus insolitus]MDC3413362.1 DNA primase [Terrihalobacillus insolitus]MDC3424945.1 DNA primase [Terrihalobacillus insolitus]